MRALALLPLLALTAAAPADERRYMVTGFDRLRVQGPFEVEVVPGSPGAVATGAPAELDALRVRVEGGTLIVNTGARGWERRTKQAPGPVKVRVSVPSLRSLTTNGGAKIRVAQMRGTRIDLTVEGAGSLDVAGIRADALHLSHTGMGTVTLAGTAGQVRVRGAVAGSVDAARLQANDAVLLWESRGALRIGVRYTAQVSNIGLGLVTVLGRPECRSSGTGAVACERGGKPAN